MSKNPKLEAVPEEPSPGSAAAEKSEMEPTLEELKLENEKLRLKIKALEKEGQWDRRFIAIQKVFAGFLGRIGLRLFAGERLYDHTRTLWDAWASWLRDRNPTNAEQLEPATRDFAAALVARLVKIPVIGLAFAALPLVALILQTVLLYRQNNLIEFQNGLTEKQTTLLDGQNKLIEFQNGLAKKQTDLLSGQNGLIKTQTELMDQQTKFLSQQNKLFENQNDLAKEQTNLLSGQNHLIETQNNLQTEQTALLSGQNEKIEQQTGLQAFEQTSRFREMLRLPREIVGEVGKGKMRSTAPNPSIVAQIALLGEKEPEVVIPALRPLLTDGEETIAAGALLAIQTLVKHRNPKVKERVEAALYQWRNYVQIGFIHKVNAGSALKDAPLSGAALDGAILTNADMTDVHLDFAHLIRANLTDTNLSSASLNNAHLNDAYLIRAILCSANLSDAVLSGADLSGADLRGAFISYNQNELITAEYLKAKGAIFDEKTKFGPWSP